MTTTHETLWETHFPDPAERHHWRHHFDRALAAARYRTHFTDPATAATWHGGFFPAVYAAYLHAHHVSPEDAHIRTVLNDFPDSVDDPSSEDDQVFFTRAALRLTHAHLTTDDAHLLARTGLTPTEADALIAAGPLDHATLTVLAGLQ